MIRTIPWSKPLQMSTYDKNPLLYASMWYLTFLGNKCKQTKGRSQTPCQLYSPKNAIATVEDAHAGLWQQKKRRKKPEVRPASFVFSDSIRASLNLPPPPLGHWASSTKSDQNRDRRWVAPKTNKKRAEFISNEPTLSSSTSNHLNWP